MKTPRCQTPRAHAFTLLEVIIVLAITALLLSAVYSVAQGTLVLADDVRRAQRRDARTQAFTSFCEHLLGGLPAPGILNLTTSQKGGQYQTMLELDHVTSPFNGMPNSLVTLFTEVQPGGGLRLILSSKPSGSTAEATRVVLFEDLAQCEWSAYNPAVQQWATLWAETNPTAIPTPAAPAVAGAPAAAAVPVMTPAAVHPPLMKLVMQQAGGELMEQVFWIAPVEAVTAGGAGAMR